MLPDFLKARTALKKKQHTFLIASIRQQTPSYIRQANFKTIYEGDRMAVHYEEGQIYEKPISLISAESGPGSITALKSNPNQIYQHLTEMAKVFVEKQIGAMIKTVQDVTEMTGNVVTGTGLTVDAVFAILEKLSISFDETGEPVFPSIMVNPDDIGKVAKILADIQTEPELKKRHDQLIETKRQQWNDRQNSRKLVG